MNILKKSKIITGFFYFLFLFFVSSISANSANAALGIYGSYSDVDMRGAWDSVISGNYAYVAGYTSDCLAILDITTITSPTKTGSICDPVNLNGAYNVFVYGNYAYVTSRDALSFSVIDVSNPASPVRKSTIFDTMLGTPIGVYVSGNYAFVATHYRMGLTAINISNPDSPIIVSEITDARLNGAWNLTIVGNLAYVTSRLADRLTIIDIGNPAAMTILGSVNDSDMLNTAYSVDVSGNYAYVTARDDGHDAQPQNVKGDRMTVVDISNSASPIIKGSVRSTSYLNGAKGVKVFGGVAYVSGYDSDTLTVINVADPANPTITEWLQDGVNLYKPYGLSFRNGYAYVASEDTAAVTGRFNIISGIPDTINPTLTTEAWRPDSVGVQVANGGTVNYTDIDQVDEKVTIYSTASDDSGLVADHKIRYWINGALQPVSSWATGGLHSVAINGPLAQGDVIEYQSEATDGSGNTSLSPSSGRYSFTVSIPQCCPLSGDCTITQNPCVMNGVYSGPNIDVNVNTGTPLKIILTGDVVLSGVDFNFENQFSGASKEVVIGGKALENTNGANGKTLLVQGGTQRFPSGGITIDLSVPNNSTGHGGKFVYSLGADAQFPPGSADIKIYTQGSNAFAGATQSGGDVEIQSLGPASISAASVIKTGNTVVANVDGGKVVITGGANAFQSLTNFISTSSSGKAGPITISGLSGGYFKGGLHANSCEGFPGCGQSGGVINLAGLDKYYAPDCVSVSLEAKGDGGGRILWGGAGYFDLPATTITGAGGVLDLSQAELSNCDCLNAGGTCRNQLIANNGTVLYSFFNTCDGLDGLPLDPLAVCSGGAGLPDVQFSSISSSESESITPANLQVSLSAVSASNVTVNYAVTGGTATGGGVDYSLANGTATIVSGNLTANIPTIIVDDAITESNETIIVTLSAPSNATLGANTVHTYTINDNDTTADPLGCLGNTINLLFYRDLSSASIGGVVHTAVTAGASPSPTGCNASKLRITLRQPALDGTPTGTLVVLDGNKSLKRDGSLNTCYYESAAGLAMCPASAIYQQVPGMDWTANVNGGVLIATVQSELSCPSGTCIHDAIPGSSVSSIRNLNVDIVTAPAKVTGLSAVAGNSQIDLSWTAPSNGGSPITNYKIYRSTVSGAETLLVSGGCSSLGNVLACTDTSLTNGIIYYYKVSAVNIIGEGPQSDEVSAIPTALLDTLSALNITSPNGHSIVQGNVFAVNYSLSDPDSVTTAALYYDNDTNNANGYVDAISLCGAIPESAGAICNWNTAGVTSGNYYVYGVTSDGTNDYSGMITIGTSFAYTITNPDDIILITNSNTTVNVPLTKTSGNSQSVSLSYSAAPSDVTFGWSGGASSCSPNPSCVPTLALMISVLSTAAPGTYPITITGTSAGLLDQSVTFNLTIVGASQSGNLEGFAWSDTVGWISFSSKDCDIDNDGIFEGALEDGGAAPAICPSAGTAFPYGVQMDLGATPIQDLSGYAWSENIGWISFNWPEIEDFGSGCPSGLGVNCAPRLDVNEFKGWARACSVFSSGCSGVLKLPTETGGWDGWISLNESDCDVQGGGPNGFLDVACGGDNSTRRLNNCDFDNNGKLDVACGGDNSTDIANSCDVDNNDFLDVACGGVDNASIPINVGYRVSYTDPNLSGWAWGSEVMGWISFDGVRVRLGDNKPILTIFGQTPIDYCVKDLAGAVSLKWDFNDFEDGYGMQTAYEIEIDRSDGELCRPGKQGDSITPNRDMTLLGTEINALCPIAVGEFIEYGGHTYTWKLRVFDSDNNFNSGSADGFLVGDMFPVNGPTPAHRYPIANFTVNPPGNWIALMPIDLDPFHNSLGAEKTQSFVTAPIPNKIDSLVWIYDGVPMPAIDPGDPPYAEGAHITTKSDFGEGPHNIDLEVTDSDGITCRASQRGHARNIDVLTNKPKWNEAAP